LFKDKPWNIVMLCAGCKKESRAIAASLGLCAECLSSGESVFDGHAGLVHRRVRARFALPTTIPRGLGRSCKRCANECAIPDGGSGFCGVRRSVGGKLKGGNARDGYVHWYTDPLPTNCVADWVCPAGTGAGYPLFANNDGPEIGFLNLAVFYFGCTFDCLFCQNWQCRKVTGERTKTAEELAAAVEDAVSCICYFGGEPSPQIHHALAAARRARRARSDGILRICWESNGSMSPALLGPMIDISLESGGCIKFDIKAFNAELHRALTGAGNDRTLSNVDLIAGHLERRPEPPLFIASTLLVPGYVDEEEVSRIADFLAQRSPDIPYTLLAFSPQFEMRDLPPTSREQAERCYIAAIQAGLNRVRIGNMHLLLS
jgi:pyruvate formate lyase activating enzyme